MAEQFACAERQAVPDEGRRGWYHHGESRIWQFRSPRRLHTIRFAACGFQLRQYQRHDSSGRAIQSRDCSANGAADVSHLRVYPVLIGCHSRRGQFSLYRNRQVWLMMEAVELPVLSSSDSNPIYMLGSNYNQIKKEGSISYEK